MKFAWRLSEDGKAMDVFSFDPITRQLKQQHRLQFTKPQTEEGARKAFEVIYPDSLSPEAIRSL